MNEILQIVEAGQSILSERADEVMFDAETPLEPQISKWKRDNWSTLMEMVGLMKEEVGLGLSAPQVGIPQRFFVMEPSFTEDVSIVINPHKPHFASADMSYAWEACPSLPGIRGLVARPNSINVNYLEAWKGVMSKQMDGIEARIFLHELDHLEGILFLERVDDHMVITEKVYREGKDFWDDYAKNYVKKN